MSEKEFYVYEIYCGIKAYKHNRDDKFEWPGKLVDGRESKTAILFEENVEHHPDTLLTSLRKNIKIFQKHYKLDKAGKDGIDD